MTDTQSQKSQRESIDLCLARIGGTPLMQSRLRLSIRLLLALQTCFIAHPTAINCKQSKSRFILRPHLPCPPTTVCQRDSSSMVEGIRLSPLRHSVKGSEQDRCPSGMKIHPLVVRFWLWLQGFDFPPYVVLRLCLDIKKGKRIKSPPSVCLKSHNQWLSVPAVIALAKPTKDSS